MYLNEATLLHNVKLRYMKNGIYVRILYIYLRMYLCLYFCFQQVDNYCLRTVFENQ